MTTPRKRTPKKPDPTPEYKTAFIVMVDEHGDTVISTDFTRSFGAHHPASMVEIRRAAQDILWYAQSMDLRAVMNGQVVD